ncbi:hypothetical protein Tco_0861672 [Tanacetum coccineum]|uniref:Reverse transcriptase domain-containing protein n=1 Tax=Tanacetum coccineum TaxID=301880 RepID=A0ABQ5BIL3_9ASTR
MTTTKEGMSFAEVEQIIAQRVDNAIETIAIYETKTRMARESTNQNIPCSRDGQSGCSPGSHQKSNLLKKGASPKTATEIHHFLDFAGYYQRFIEGFPKIAKSIAKLYTRKKGSRNGIHIDANSLVEEPVEILDREVKKLRQSRIPIIKVRWNSKRGPEFTWERKDQFREKYPHLFTKIVPSSSVAT